MSVKRYHWAVDGMWDSYGNGPPAYYGDDGEFVVFRRGNEWVRAEDYDALEDETERLREECAQRRMDCKRIRREMQEENERLKAEVDRLRDENKLYKWFRRGEGEG